MVRRILLAPAVLRRFAVAPSETSVHFCHLHGIRWDSNRHNPHRQSVRSETMWSRFRVVWLTCWYRLRCYYSMEQCASWESDSRSARQEYSKLVCNLKIDCKFQNSPYYCH